MTLTAEEFTEMADLAAELGDEEAELEALEGLESTGELGDIGDAIVEPIKAIAGSIGTEIAAGLGGIVQTLNPLAEQGAGAQAVEDIRAAAPDFSPQTQAGQAGLETVGQLIEAGVDLANIPLSGLEGLSRLIKGQGIDQAVATIRDIQEIGLGQNLGARALEGTGSPLLATVAELSPDIAGIVAGAPAAGAGRRAAVDATGKAIAPVVQGGRELVEVASEIFSRQSPTKQRIAEKLSAGEFDRDTAGFRLEAPIEATAEEVAQAAATGAPAAPRVTPRVQTNKLENAALKQGFDKGVIASIKGAKEPDKAKMLKMVNIMERGKNNARFAADNRPSDVLGNSLMTRVEIIQRANFSAGRDIDRVADTLKGERVDISEAVSGFADSLDTLGVRLIPDSKGGIKPDFELSQLSPGDRGPIKEVIRQMNLRGRGGVDGFAAHKMKRVIDNNVTFGKSKTGISGDAERALKSFRTALDDTLDTNFPEYNKVNSAYSETIGALNALQEVAGKKMNLSGPNADKATGTLMRRVLSNAQSRITLLDSLNEIESVAKKFENFKTGKADPRLIEGPAPPTKLDDDLLNQVLFVDELDAQFGTTARTSFQGQIQQGIEQAAQATVSPVGAVIKAGATGVEKLRNINEAGAFKAIKELLKEVNK